MKEEQREPEKTSEENPPDSTDNSETAVQEKVPEVRESENQPSSETAAEPHLKKPLAMRHIVFRASSNSFYLTITMFTVVLLYGICVIFLVPVEWLQKQNWEVFKSIKALFYLMMTTLLVFPVSLLFQLLIAGMVREFNRYKWQMEMGGLAAGLLLCSLFFWPGWFL